MRREAVMDVQVERIFAAAHERAQKDHLPYFGALSPSDAYAVIRAVPNARLIDAHPSRMGLRRPCSQLA
jgi:hypothetical protein